VSLIKEQAGHYHVFLQFVLQAGQSTLASESDRVSLNSRQTAGTAKACYVCYKPTTTVLATLNTVDFLYTCDAHLTDRGFASKVVDESTPKKDAVSPDEIAKLKKEWEDQQKKKAEKEKAAKEKEKEKKDEKDKDKDETKPSSSKTSPSDTPSIPGSLSSSPPPASHERYTLHRDFFAS
jgi:hypothetical protein